LQEEKEKRLEEMFDADLDNAFENKYVPKEEIPEEGAVAVAGKKTQETLTATDLIIERLDIAENEKKRIAEHQVILISLRALLFSKLMYYLASDSARHICEYRYTFIFCHSACTIEKKSDFRDPVSDYLQNTHTHIYIYISIWLTFTDLTRRICSRLECTISPLQTRNKLLI
jgi:hypothetical protein